MTVERRLDARIVAWLDEGPTHLVDEDRRALAVLAERTAQRRGIVARLLGARHAPSGTGRPLALAAGTVVLVVTVALIGSSLIAGAPAGSGATPSPTVDPTLPDLDPALWSGRAFPAPMREEPDGGAPSVDAPGSLLGVTSYMDGWDDPVPLAEAMVDLGRVSVSRGCWRIKSACITFTAATGRSIPADPAESWVAYGLVIDVDGDGRPDHRVGFDNRVPGRIQMWRTDLRTDTTLFAPLGAAEWDKMDVDSPDGSSGHIYVTQSLTIPMFRFYVWAALIRDGRIVSMDFAPDTGWIEP